MRTRQSPRNQEILWRELGRQGAPVETLPFDHIAELERQLGLPYLNARTRRIIERERVAARRKEALRRPDAGATADTGISGCVE